MREWLREPLLQFLVLGAVLFLLDAWLNDRGSGQADNPYRIVITQQHLDALNAAFRAEQGRAPSDAELQLRLQQWLDEQMLYREALALGLDQRDAIVRRQMVQKMRFLLADTTPVADPSEAQLQAWLLQHAQRYGHSPSLSFDQVFISRGQHGDQMLQQAQAWLVRLQENPEAHAQLGDAFSAGRRIERADAAGLERDFGRGFYERIQSLDDGQWQGPVASGLGLHLIRITDRQDFIPARLAEVRQQVETDWRLAQRQVANNEAMRRLRQRFEVEYAAPADEGAS